MKKILAFLVVLCSISFSSLVWQADASGSVTTKPLAFSNGIAVASAGGSVTLINPASGGKIWKAPVAGNPVQPVLLQSWIVVATDNGKIDYIKADGTMEREIDLSSVSYNVTHLFGIDASDTKLFVTTNKGVFAISTGGTEVAQIFNSTDIRTAPVVFGSSIFFGEGVNLVKATDKGIVEWRSDVGGIWLSRPIVDGQSVYVGGLDNRLHALTLSGGAERWTVETGNWVLSSPIVKGNQVYFGSNDGKVYAVQTDGRLLWAASTPLAIQTKPEPGLLGGREVIFVGSTANAVYAIELENGSTVWKGSASGWGADPLYYQKRVIFGSQDKAVYSFSTERACSITSPADGAVVGPKEINVVGNVVSESGSPTVYVSINEGIMEEANTSEGGWFFYLNPSNLKSGLNSVSCKVSDAAGEEGGSFTTVEIVRDPAIKSSNLVVSTSGSLLDGEQFAIHVNDGDDGSPVERFTVTLDGQTFNGSGSVNVTLNAGSYQMTVKKTGYNNSVKTVNVASKGISPIYLGIGVVVIAAVGWFIFKRFRK